MAQGETKLQRLRKRLTSLEQERATWLPVWRELAEQIRPGSYRTLWTDANKGTRREGQIINSTPVYAARTLAAGMMSGITSPSRPWFRLTTPSPTLKESGAVRQWLSDVEDAIREVLAKSNVYNSLHVLYTDLAVPGTSAMLVEEDDEDVVRATVFPIGQYSLAANEKGRVDTVFRRFGMTVRQVVRAFGLEKCSMSLKAKHESGQLDAWVEVAHAILPNEDYEAGKLGPKGKKWASCWWEHNVSEAEAAGNGFLRESGFDDFPVMAPRWEVVGEDVYGRSPGRTVLGDCKALQTLERRKGQLTEKAVNPPMRAPASLQNQRTSILPGDTTYVPDSSVAHFAPAHEVSPQSVAVAGAEIQRHELRIEKGFYADLWLMLSQADGTMTAREVIERREEKLLQLGSVLERLQSELLKPLIERVFSILLKKGLLPPPPQELQGQELRVEYLNIMAAAQKLQGTVPIERLLTVVGNVAAIKPEVMDKIDLDQTVDEYADMLGVPPGMIRPDDLVAQIRQQAQQQQQQAQALAAAQAAATTGKTMAETPVGAGPTGEGGTSALDMMLKGMGAA